MFFFSIFGRNEPNRQKDRIKISTFTKFGYVSLRGNQAVKGRPNSIQKSNSETASRNLYNTIYNTIFILPHTTITDGKKMMKIDERK